MDDEGREVMDMKYWRARRVVGHLFIKLAFIVFFGWLPSKLIIKIGVSGEDTGELVIRMTETMEIQPKAT